jgi:glycosyltransferase involved in cell wall biosynthesis
VTRVLVVVPALNEQGSVGQVVRGLRAAGFDCAVVDDGSSDATADVARAAGAAVLRLPFNLGVGGALRCGFRYAVERGYDLVVQCDADGQHPPEQVAELVTAQAATGAHLVIGSRFLPGANTYEVGGVRRRTMRVLAWMVRRVGGVSVQDTTSGFRCIAQPLLGEFARSYPVHYLGDTFEALLAAGRGGYRVVEVPAEMRVRSHGTPSASRLRSVVLVGRVVLVTLMGTWFRIRPWSETRTAPDRTFPPVEAPPPPPSPVLGGGSVPAERQP